MKPYIPQGCDQQGRISQPWPYTRPPEPADAATEIGCADDDHDDGFALFFVALGAAIIGLLTMIITYVSVYG